MIAIDPQGKRPYTTESDRKLPEAQRTVWQIRDLSERERVEYMDAVKLTGDGAGGAQIGGTGMKTYVAVKNGLVGYEDAHPLFDSKGNAVPFTRDEDGRVSDAFLERIDWAEKREIGQEIVSTMVLSVADTEKSEPSLTD